MLKLAFRAVLAKKWRLLGTATSVVLAVAFLSGTLVFTDTIQRTFDDLFASVYDETDAFVRAEGSVELDFGTQRDRLPGSTTIDAAASVPGVADAKGFLGGYAQIVGADGEAIGNPGRGAPTFGMSYVEGALNPVTLTEGSRAPRAGEVVVDAASAATGDLHVGDTVTVLTQTGPHELRLVGTIRFGSVDSPGGASIAMFDLATTQQLLLGGVDEIDAVMVDAGPGVTETELAQRISGLLADGVEVLTGTEIIDETQDAMREGLSFFNTFMLVFAGIGFVVACFTIYNTFQIIVTQRRREMALLRSVGATRTQVLWSQLIEALLVGVMASVVGVFAGFGVAAALKRLLEGVGIDIPGGAIVLHPRTVIVAMMVGTVVTVASAVIPSLRASRVPPLAAIRATATEAGAAQVRAALILGGALSALGVAAFVAGLAGGEILWVGVGALLTFLGVFTLGPVIARPAAVVFGGAASRAAGVVGAIARQNAARNPKRTARTGGALTVGVALVIAITVIAATAKDWTRDVIGEQFNGDFVVSTDSFGFGGLSPDVAARLNELPEVAVAAGIRLGAAHDEAGSGDIAYVAVDPVTASQVFDLGMVEGTTEALTSDGLLIDDNEASGRGVGVGDRIGLTFIDGTSASLVVQGIYRKDDLAGDFVISTDRHEATGVDQFDFSIYVAKAPGASDAAAAAAITSVSDAYPNAELQSRSEYIDDQAAQIDQLVNLMYGLLGLAIVIALFNIANSVALSIHERTRELGLARAVGMTRHQTASSVRWEAAIVGMLGTFVGALLGLFFGWAISVTLRGDGVTAVTVPLQAVVVIVAIGVAGGVLVAVRPAWRAAHLDVLSAIATE